jgi:hypothetical protein
MRQLLIRYTIYDNDCLLAAQGWEDIMIDQPVPISAKPAESVQQSSFQYSDIQPSPVGSLGPCQFFARSTHGSQVLRVRTQQTRCPWPRSQLQAQGEMPEMSEEGLSAIYKSALNVT